MRRRLLLGEFALVSSLLFSLAAYRHLPDRVAVHWTAASHPNGFASRLVAAVVIPFATAVLAPLVARVLPLIDPHRNFESHERTYWFVWNAVMVALAAFQTVVISAGLGWDVNVAFVVPFLTGILLLVTGNVIGRLRPNWFVGIKTPWTLSSDEVWRRTHRLAAKTTMGAGLLLIIGAMSAAGWVRIATWVAAIGLAAAAPAIYSYLEWRRLTAHDGPAR